MSLVGGAILLAVSAVLLRNFGWKGAPVFSALAIVVILSELSFAVSELTSFFSFLSNSGMGDLSAAALKILGCGYLFGICADLCRELGEGGIAKAVEVVGRAEIIIIVLPFLKEFINSGGELW